MPGDRTKFDEFHHLSAEQKAVLESIHGHSDVCALGRDVGNASSEQGYFVRYPNFCCGSQASVTTSAGGWRLKWMVKSSISEALWEVCDCEEGIEFKTRYGNMLNKLERQFLSFPSPIRKELLVWFQQKLLSGSRVFILKADGEEPLLNFFLISVAVIVIMESLCTQIIH
jgi:hypothetical protein